MLTYTVISAFLWLNISLCLIPSPEMVYVITQSSLQGRMAGIVFIGGVCFALAIQVLIMALGISALFQTIPFAFIALKIVGVCYLLYLAWQALTQHIDITTSDTKREGAIALFGKGVAINLTNPMNPLYLLIVFPNFVSPDQGSIFYQFLQLGTLMIAIIFIMFSLMSIAGEFMGKTLLQSDRFRQYLQRGTAITILCFAVYLLLLAQPS